MSFDFKTANKAELNKEYKRIASIIGDDQFLTKKELNHLPEILQNNEQLLAFSSGLMDGNSWLIALTDRRIIFLDKGLVYGLTQQSIPLNRVNAVSGSTGMIFGSITITDGSKDRKITNVWKKTVIPFTNLCQEAISNFGNPQQQQFEPKVEEPEKKIIDSSKPELKQETEPEIEKQIDDNNTLKVNEVDQKDNADTINNDSNNANEKIAVKTESKFYLFIKALFLYSASIIFFLIAISSLIQSPGAGGIIALIGALFLLPKIHDKLGFTQKLSKRQIFFIGCIVGFIGMATNAVNVHEAERIQAEKEKAEADRISDSLRVVEKKKADSLAVIEFKNNRGSITREIQKLYDKKDYIAVSTMAYKWERLGIEDSNIKSLQLRAEKAQARIQEKERLRIAREEKKRLEQEAREAAKKARHDEIKKQFSSWDGSHMAFVRAIKNRMNDPKSYEHIETRYVDNGKTLTVICKFRGRNGFGGLVVNTMMGTIDSNGDVISIYNAD